MKLPNCTTISQKTQRTFLYTKNNEGKSEKKTCVYRIVAEPASSVSRKRICYLDRILDRRGQKRTCE